MKQKYKIISMDFDGTLLTSDKKISERTKNCLLRLKKQSYLIVGVTARNILSAKSVIDLSLFDYIILNNGCDIYYIKEDKVDSISCLDNKVVNDIYNEYKDISPQIDFCTANKYLMRTEEKRDSRPFIVYIKDINEVNEPVSRMNLFFENTKELNNHKKIIEDKYKKVDVIRMIDTDKSNSRLWVTLNPKKINKLNTLKKLCQELHCTIDDVIFFGDGENDLILIENVGLGVAMGNALDIVKEKASKVTLSNDNDGIAEFLEKEIGE